jgi:hypothetical protein
VEEDAPTSASELAGKADGAGPSTTGDIVEIEGRVLGINEYVTDTGAEISRIYVSRPTIGGEPVRSAYLKACTGPSEDICLESGFEMVELQLEPGAPIVADGLITLVWEKLYYSTYYLDAVSDVVAAG